MCMWMIREAYDAMPNTWNVKNTFIISIQKSLIHIIISICYNMLPGSADQYNWVCGQIYLPLLHTIFWKDNLISCTNTSWLCTHWVGSWKKKCFGPIVILTGLINDSLKGQDINLKIFVFLVFWAACFVRFWMWSICLFLA